jgi:hypothetical protein
MLGELLEYYEALKMCWECKDIVEKLRKYLDLISFENGKVDKKVKKIMRSDDVNEIRETLFELIFMIA